MNTQSAHPDVILQGTLDYYDTTFGNWQSSFFTLLNDGQLHFYPSREELSNQVGTILINSDVTVSKYESSTNGQTMQIIQLDLKVSGHEPKPGKTCVLATRYKSVQEAWVQVLTRFSNQSQTAPAKFKIYSRPIQFEGMLEKRGYWNPAWKQRYFVLTEDGMLSYFPSHADSRSAEPLGTVSVCNAVITPTSAAADRAQFTVLVKDPACPSHGRTYILAAASADLLARWLRELERAARTAPSSAETPASAAAASSLSGGSGGGTERDRPPRRSGSSRCKSFSRSRENDLPQGFVRARAPMK
jgi:hypothetical protein